MKIQINRVLRGKRKVEFMLLRHYMKRTLTISLIAGSVSLLMTACMTVPPNGSADVYRVSPAYRATMGTVLLKVGNIRTWKSYSHANPGTEQYKSWGPSEDLNYSEPDIQAALASTANVGYRYESFDGADGTTVQFYYDGFTHYSQNRPLRQEIFFDGEVLASRLDFTYSGWASMPHGSDASGTQIWDVWLYLENQGTETATIDLADKETGAGVDLRLQVCDGSLLDVAGFDMEPGLVPSNGLVKSIEHAFGIRVELEPREMTWVRAVFEVPVPCTAARLLFGSATPIQLELRPLTEVEGPPPRKATVIEAFEEKPIRVESSAVDATEEKANEKSELVTENAAETGEAESKVDVQPNEVELRPLPGESFREFADRLRNQKKQDP